MDTLRNWILALTGAALLGSVCKTVVPEGKTRAVVLLLCAAVGVIALLGPIRSLNEQSLTDALAYDFGRRAALSDALEEENDALRRTYIEQACQSYIAERAEKLGITDLTVSVRARWDERGCWVPYEARLSTAGSAQRKRELSLLLETELGIPPDRQHWGESDNE